MFSLDNIGVLKCLGAGKYRGGYSFLVWGRKFKYKGEGYEGDNTLQ